MAALTREDLPLTAADVAHLDSVDAIADFFTRLGYPAGTRVPMTAQALSLNRELTDATRRVERLTSVEGVLEIYLFELTSVTVARTRALMRAFRDRGADYRALLARIGETDELIDEIVYRLYGLTEEEIAVVEGQA